ncbi:MAG: arginine decarboxylase, pyruvoyl-dependent [Caldiserica bacterium]|nr:arginine decarboxylase, pyruvoyl-dependent [Caldisericota bacterium]
MVFETPTKFFLVRGEGEASFPLTAFDAALLDSGVGNTNLLKVSSILPPACNEIEPITLPFGVLVPVAYAALTSDEPGEVIAAAVSVAVPQDNSKPGLIMEVSGKGTSSEIERKACEMVEEGMAIRKEPISRILSISVEHRVIKVGAVFAGVVLWK